ncbi:MAG: hypothetical protein LBV41_06075 [Cytophagaceae bacterium]|jgi:aminoglycoside 6'-N-acetyltransferase I|nr:hypothetical protein [Cytophagaceae bacterium]
MMTGIEKIAVANNYKTVIVGTGDCSVCQIWFYELNCYVLYDVKKNFFIDNFPELIYENGVLLRSMVMLKKEINLQANNANLH